MRCKLSQEKAMTLDKLMRSAKSEIINIEVSSDFQIYLTAPDLSQLTTIRLDAAFFDEFECGTLVQASFTPRRFYEPNMRSLEMSLEGSQMKLKYVFDHMRHIKTFECQEADLFDLEFQGEREAEIELFGLRRILKDVRDKEVRIQMSDTLKISGENLEISIPQSGLDVEFSIDTEKLRSLVNISDNFYTTKFSFSSEPSPLNITMEAPDIFLSTFVSIE